MQPWIIFLFPFFLFSTAFVFPSRSILSSKSSSLFNGNGNGNEEFNSIKNLKILSSTDGALKTISSLWPSPATEKDGSQEIGKELAKQIAAEIIPVLENHNRQQQQQKEKFDLIPALSNSQSPSSSSSSSSSSISLICIGIGTYERSLEFCELVKFPPKYLYADPENKVYDALGLLKSNPLTMFTDIRTPLSIAKRYASTTNTNTGSNGNGNGNDKDKRNKGEYLTDAIRNWKPWIPPKLEQGLQQGGAFVFSGENTIYGRKDPATGDHVDLDTLLQTVLPK